MDFQSIDELKMDFDIDDFRIDYDFLSEILNSETQEISSEDNLKIDLNIGITEFDFKVEPNTNGSWVKRKRFKKGTTEYYLRKEEIKIKNRISARKSIEKKEAHIRELNANLRRLEAENKFRRNVLQIFPNSKPAGRLCGLRRSFSTSDFYVNQEVTTHEEEVDMTCISEELLPEPWLSYSELFDTDLW